MKKIWCISASFFFLITVVGATLSEGALIDFEEIILNETCFSADCQNVGNTLQYNNVDGSGIDVTITGVPNLIVWDLDQFGDNSSFDHSKGLTGVEIGQDYSSTLGSGITIFFSSSIYNFSLLAGDFSFDNDVYLRITAFDSNNSILGIDETPWGLGFSPRDTAPTITDFQTLSISAGNLGISQIMYQSVGSYPNTTFIDNIAFSPAPVPEPATILLFGTGLVSLVGSRMRRKK